MGAMREDLSGHDRWTSDRSLTPSGSEILTNCSLPVYLDVLASYILTPAVPGGYADKRRSPGKATLLQVSLSAFETLRHAVKEVKSTVAAVTFPFLIRVHARASTICFVNGADDREGFSVLQLVRHLLASPRSNLMLRYIKARIQTRLDISCRCPGLGLVRYRSWM